MIRELMEKRARLVGQARAILDKAESEKRELTTEERSQWDHTMEEAQRLGKQIDMEQRQAAAEAELNQPAHDVPRPQPGATGDQRSANPRESEEYRSAFNSFLRGGMQNLSAVEHRALQADLGASGGYLVAPTQFVNNLIQALDNAVYIRQWATTFQVPNAQSLGAPSLEADPADPTWTAEIATGSEDGTMSFGKRELSPKPLAKRIKISNKLLRMVPSTEALVNARLAYKFGVTHEANFLTGAGANGPLGVFTASNDGIPTTRDVSTGNTQTEITMDGLINAKFTLKGQYWPKARWLFHRDAVKMISKLKDGEGQYMWQPSVQMDAPDMLLGRPVFMSEYVPNTFTTQLYVGIFGDFSYYWIADALDMQVQRLVELYAETNQLGLIGRMESDGMPVLSEAFVRVKLA